MNRALIVIDVQESFRRRPIWQLVSNPNIVSDVARLVEATRSRGELVVWILHAEPGEGDVFDPVNGYVQVVDELHPRADEPIITKTSVNAFTTTNLQQLLTSRGIRELVICGIQTEQCCETTTRLAADLGFDVTFVTDATATFPIEHRDAPADRSLAEIVADPLTLATADIIARTEYALAGRFATIAGLADFADLSAPVAASTTTTTAPEAVEV